LDKAPDPTAFDMTVLPILPLIVSAVALVTRDPAAASDILVYTPTAVSASAGEDATAYCYCGDGFTQPIAPSITPGPYNLCPLTQIAAAVYAPTIVQQRAYTTVLFR